MYVQPSTTEKGREKEIKPDGGGGYSRLRLSTSRALLSVSHQRVKCSLCSSFPSCFGIITKNFILTISTKKFDRKAYVSMRSFFAADDGHFDFTAHKRYHDNHAILASRDIVGPSVCSS